MEVRSFNRKNALSVYLRLSLDMTYVENHLLVIKIEHHSTKRSR